MRKLAYGAALLAVAWISFRLLHHPTNPIPAVRRELATHSLAPSSPTVSGGGALANARARGKAPFAETGGPNAGEPRRALRLMRAFAAAPRTTQAAPDAAAPSAVSDAAAVRKPIGGALSTLPTLPSIASEKWAEGKFADFTEEELADMAGRCELRWQMPPFFRAAQPSFGAGYERALAAARQRYVTALRQLYVEATGDADGAAHLSARLLADALRQRDDSAAAAQLANARTGDPVTLDGSPYERLLQLQLGAGDDFEHALDEEVGPERAHALRLGAGPKFTLTGCDPQHALFRSQR